MTTNTLPTYAALPYAPPAAPVASVAELTALDNAIALIRAMNALDTDQVRALTDLRWKLAGRL